MIDLIHIKYTQQGARGLLEEGFCARRAEVQRVAEQYGERVAGYWVTDDGEWDVVFVLEGPDNADHPAGGVAANLRGQASGKSNAMLFSYPNVEGAIGKCLGKNIHACSTRHCCRDGDDAIVLLCFLDQAFAEHFGV